MMAETFKSKEEQTEEQEEKKGKEWQEDGARLYYKINIPMDQKQKKKKIHPGLCGLWELRVQTPSEIRSSTYE